jgi:O-succinylbenzoate synthase
MKVQRIRLNHLRMPLVSPFETSFGRISTRDCILVEAFAGDWVGLGECVADRDPGFSYETIKTAWHIMQDYLAPVVLDQDIESPPDFYPLVASVRGHSMAKAGIEMALWDLQGKMLSKPLRELLGGTRERVPVGVSVGLQASPQALVETVGEYLESGYQRIKIKIKPGRDLQDTRAVREAYPDLMLQVDANSAYTLESARALTPLDELDLLLIEQPLAEDDMWDHRHLQKQLRTAICLDESIRSPRHARQALDMEACRVINIKTGRVGGLTQAVEIHRVCVEKKVPVWCGGMLETGVGRAANLALASLPGFSLPGDISATRRYYHQDITQEVFSLNADSSITVPGGPGLGVSIDDEALERFTLSKLDLGT